MKRIFSLLLCFTILGCALNLSAQQNTTNDAWLKYNAEKKSEALSGILEACIPLVGHAYVGDVKRGFVPAAVSVGGLALAIIAPFSGSEGSIVALGSIGWLAYLGGRVWGVVSAINTANDYNANLRNKLNLSLQPINDPQMGTLGYGLALTVNF